MAIVLNRCERCNSKIQTNQLAYFALNDRTDRFDLECEKCHAREEMMPHELAFG